MKTYRPREGVGMFIIFKKNGYIWTTGFVWLKILTPEKNLKGKM